LNRKQKATTKNVAFLFAEAKSNSNNNGSISNNNGSNSDNNGSNNSSNNNLEKASCFHYL
jgi:hypothetical protein